MPPFIVTPGREAYQLPERLFNLQSEPRLDGPARRVLAMILWEAAAREVWPARDQGPRALPLRFRADELRAGAGLSNGSYARLWSALRKIEDARVLLSDGDRHFRFSVIENLTPLPGNHLDLTLSEELCALHLRPLGRYALLNMSHVRQLRTPLDVLLYELACATARMRYPQFKLHRWDLAGATDAWRSWDALRRPFVGSLARVAGVVGARVFVEARCLGDSSGVDEFRILPRPVAGDGTPFMSPCKRGAIRLEVSGRGVSRLL
jgi:hypothetical protein